MLEGVLAPGGTASEVSVPGYTLAGKTGTAEVAEDGGYSETKFVASFIGFAPASNPRPAGRGGRRRAAGRRLLRRLGRRAGLRRDRRASRCPIWACRPSRREGRSSDLESAAVKLAELLEGADVDGDHAAIPRSRSADLAYDSRKVGAGTLFFCVPGQKADGHDFAPAAVRGRRRGAGRRARARRWTWPRSRVADARAAMAPLAARFWGDPTARAAGRRDHRHQRQDDDRLPAAARSSRQSGRQCGLLGTVKQVVGGVEEEVVRTTPEAIDLQATFRRMLDAGDRGLRDGGLLARARPAPRRRDPTSTSPCSPT